MKAIVYFNPKAISHKKLPCITKEEVYDAFNREDLLVFTNSIYLKKYLRSLNWENQNLLMMSSGNFDNLDIRKIIS